MSSGNNRPIDDLHGIGGAGAFFLRLLRGVVPVFRALLGRALGMNLILFPGISQWQVKRLLAALLFSLPFIFLLFLGMCDQALSVGY